MIVTRQDLAEYYASLNEDELRRLLASQELTPLAIEVAIEELRNRGVEIPEPTDKNPPVEEIGVDGGDLVLLGRYTSPMEAEMVRGLLNSEGVQAVIADAHIVQTTALMSLAFGGVRVLVPDTQLVRACEILKSIERR
jgi:hypothetical protein